MPAAGNGLSAPRSLSSLANIVEASKRPKAFTESTDGSGSGLDTMLCKRVVTKDRRYITQITCFEKGQPQTYGGGDAAGARHSEQQRTVVPATNGMPGSAGAERNALRLPVFGKQQGGGALASLFSLNRQLGMLRSITYYRSHMVQCLIAESSKDAQNSIIMVSLDE